VIPNWQIGHLSPQSDEEGTDIYPMPQSGMVTRGARVYAANGCIYCHSEQVRAEYAGADIERKWGDRRSAPRDYIFERPVFLGKARMGQDLANIGARAPKQEESPSPGGVGTPAGSPSGATQTASPSTGQPKAQAAQSPGSSPPQQQPVTSPAASPAPSPASPSPKPPAVAGPNTGIASPSPAAAPVAAASPGAPPLAGPPWPEQTAGLPPMYSAAWHHVHLYSPRSINLDSNMPSYRFLYQARRISDARSSDALQLSGSDAPREGWEIVPTYDAKCLVAYMMALNQSHPLKEVRSAGAAPAVSPAASPSPASAGQPPK
jgi:cbb3-type cytochrome oxidase cytochrome c subunit